MMEFISFDLPKKSLTLKKAPVPKPQSEEVLIKVAYSGICGTDLHIIEGNFPCKSTSPITLGHEFSGIVEAVGDSVKKFKVGDRVAVDPNSGCNLCDECHGGCYHFCQTGGLNSTVGIFKDGGWSTHAIIPQTQVFKLPAALELRQACLCEPLSCLAHGWDRMNPIDVGTKVLVLGAGIIGLLWACVLHLHGVKKTVTISEPNESRREIVKKLGLNYDAVHPNELKNKKFDLVVDCSGSGPAIESAARLLSRGGRMCVFGASNPKTTINISPYQIFKDELTFSGVNINPFTFPKSISLAEVMSDDYLSFDNLGIKTYKLSEFQEALDTLKRGGISKAVFKM